MKKTKLEFYCILTFGLSMLTQISFAQGLIVRPNDTTSNHIMVEPQNTFFGVFFGFQAGRNNTGCCNTFIGSTTGGLNSTGVENSFLGTGAGEQNVLGNGNTYLGRWAGKNSIGSGNVFLGRYAGFSEMGNDQLYIDNINTSLPLLHGFFAKDSLVINGDLNVTGDLIAESINESQITGILRNGHSGLFPSELTNTVKIEISGVIQSNVLITNPIGFELDTFSLHGDTCISTHIGFMDEFPITFETDKPSDLVDLNNWFANPSVKSISMIFEDLAGNETSRINMFEYYPGTTSAGSNGRTSYTLYSGVPNSSSVLQDFDSHKFRAIEISDLELGSMHSFNPATDKIVEISGITHSNFTPSVQVDYTSRVITLEVTYNEGDGLIDWIIDVSEGMLGQSKSMSIIETIDGVTEISRENFSNVLPFKYEIICGLGLNTKMITRIKLLYGCNAPG